LHHNIIITYILAVNRGRPSSAGGENAEAEQDYGRIERTPRQPPRSRHTTLISAVACYKHFPAFNKAGCISISISAAVSRFCLLHLLMAYKNNSLSNLAINGIGYDPRIFPCRGETGVPF